MVNEKLHGLMQTVIALQFVCVMSIESICA